MLRISAPLLPLCCRGDVSGDFRPLAFCTADATKRRQVTGRQVTRRRSLYLSRKHCHKLKRFSYASSAFSCMSCACCRTWKQQYIQEKCSSPSLALWTASGGQPGVCKSMCLSGPYAFSKARHRRRLDEAPECPTSDARVRWRSTASLDDLTASALGALGLRSSFGGRDNSTVPVSAEQYRYPIGNHGRWTARCRTVSEHAGMYGAQCRLKRHAQWQGCDRC